LRSLAGKLSLPLLAACLARLSCYLTNDSGPMHLAWVQHVPVTALFGPTVRSLGFFPRGEGSSVLEAAVPCRPCGLHGPAACPLRHHQCMLRIAVDDVWRDVEGKLWKEARQGATTFVPRPVSR
jgi:heptosyltransferase-2